MLLTQSAVRSGVVRRARWPLHLGGELRDVRIAYSLYGDATLPVVVALGGISAGRHIAPGNGAGAHGWWRDFVGCGRAIDTRDFAVLGIDFLGGSGDSTGPTSAGFPAVSTFDQAGAVAAVCDDLGIASSHAFVGSSYGGMVALAFGARCADRTRKLIVIGAAHEPHPMATALRSLQRRTIQLGLESGRVADAVAIARGIAMTTYRTTTEFAARFDSAPRRTRGRFKFSVEEYLERCGETYARAYSPWGFLCLSESIDLHRVRPADVTVPTTFVAIAGDAITPPSQVHELAARLGAPAQVMEIDSIYGHDAFLKEIAAVSRILRSALYEEADCE